MNRQTHAQTAATSIFPIRMDVCHARNADGANAIEKHSTRRRLGIPSRFHLSEKSEETEDVRQYR